MNKISNYTLAKSLLLTLLLLPTFVLAEQEDLEPETLSGGVIASSGKTTASKAIGVDTSGGVPGEEAGLISASILKPSRGKCEVVISNQSEKNSYSVRYRVIGVDDRGSESLRRFFSATVAPKDSVKRPFSCDHSSNLRVELISGKKG